MATIKICINIQKFLIILCISLLVGIGIFLFFLPRAVAQAPSSQSEDYSSGQLIIKDNAIQNKSLVSPNKGKVDTLQAHPSIASYSGRNYSKEEVEALIRHYADTFGVEQSLAVRVAYCESGYNQYSKNRNSTASGVYQYLASTWRNTEAGRAGISVFDADANVRMAVKSIASGGIGNWNASKGCWK